MLLGWQITAPSAVTSDRCGLSPPRAAIGLAQALALIRHFPVRRHHHGGTFLGYHPASATRFSFLLSVPVIGVPCCDGGILHGDVGAIGLDKLIVAFVVSAVFAHVTIRGFLYLLERVGLLPFVVYRLLLGLYYGFG
ncbi:MAG: hypothetical protein CM15mP74_07640 [Halieaceae bacterium]|nr:MAG: hypothetical protein CM15mP74_07640 [Halieaceae bacterium]